MNTKCFQPLRPTSSSRITRPTPKSSTRCGPNWSGACCPSWRKHAAREYLEGFEIIGLQKDRLPNLAAISARLAPEHRLEFDAGERVLARAGVFEMLATRNFPTTTWLRSRESLEYTPEPDIFHDVFGHVPMHAHKVFADFLEHYGRVCASISTPRRWKTGPSLLVHGRVRRDLQRGEIKVYGSGLISSHGECMNVIDGHCAIHYQTGFRQ
jgi:phenylalanine-4-hydroxylase